MSGDEKVKSGWFYYLVGVICVVLVVILVILFLLSGRITINTGADSSTVKSVTCEGEGLMYPFFTYDNAKSKSTKIVASMNNNDKLDSINLVYRMEYDNPKQVSESNAVNHVDISKQFAFDSLEYDSFNARFSDLNNVMQMTLYAENRELNGITAKYFLIDGTSVFTINELTKAYNGLGLDCKVYNKRDIID